MYNIDTPLRAELPTSRQLMRSTVLAVIAALFLLVAVVLPAEYGIDPTGIGRVLRLTEMGTVKKQLAAEAAADTPTAAAKKTLANEQTPETSLTKAVVPQPVVPQAVAPTTQWRDETPFAPFLKR